MERLNEIVQEIEEEQERGLIPGFKVLRSIYNQPGLVTINSVNAVNLGQSGNGYSTFQVNLPRPVYDVESIQLLNANIPQCTQNVPDTACVFWYYRLNEYSGIVPNPDNLFMVRLMPSFYKPEFISGSANYGFNRTFVSYQDIATELALACAQDNAFTNIQIQEPDPDGLTYTVPFIPNDISITYNSRFNRFQMTGNNTTSPLVYANYSAGTTYALGAYVKNGTNKVFVSLQNGNTGNPLPSSPYYVATAYWKRVFNLTAVSDYDGATPYRTGQYVSYNNLLYQASANTLGNLPTNTSYWTTTITATNNYRYLIAGFNDPNIPIVQGTGFRQWNPYNVYEYGDIVQYQGQYWSAAEGNKNFPPFPVSFPAWSSTTQYNPNDRVIYGGVPYQCITGNTNIIPLLNTTYWVTFVYSATKQYNVGDIVQYSGAYYLAISASLNQTPGATFSAYWSPSFWTTTSTAPNKIGLAASTANYDYVDTWNGVPQFPFPALSAGQPFVNVPRRILNSILGFTWNGIMNPSYLANINSPITTPIAKTQTVVDLYNRVRPVPEYYTRISSVGLGAPLGTQQATASPIFTADGYANLNYTSIISIYTSIAASSTLDTQQNTNLLATVQMNCANLGVTFAEPTITNEILVRGAELDTISISLFDEFGSPYFITNNGVMTINLRLTYKDRINIK
jgi:hypothetical protein